MKRVLFIDRDGTLIKEPPVDYQVDSFEKNWNYARGDHGHEPHRYARLRAGDGHEPRRIGNGAFPRSDVLAGAQLMLKTFEGEGVRFDDILIDRSMPATTPRRANR